MSPHYFSVKRKTVSAKAQNINDFIALAVEGSGTGIWERNVVSGEIQYFDGWAEMLGYRPDEISSRIEDSYKRVHPDDLPNVRAKIADHFEGRTSSYECEYRLRCKDGTYKWVLRRGRVVSRDSQGRALHMRGTTTDITSMRNLAERLHQSIDLLTNLTNEAPGLVFQTRRQDDGMARFTYANARIEEIYELTYQDVFRTTTPIHERIHPEDTELYLKTLENATELQEHWFCIFRVLLPFRGLRWRQVEATLTRLDGQETIWHGLVIDVTERVQQEQELRRLAQVDALTGLPNRRAFNESIEIFRQKK